MYFLQSNNKTKSGYQNLSSCALPFSQYKISNFETATVYLFFYSVKLKIHSLHLQLDYLFLFVAYK